jgi:Glycerol uptake facilitator and related permeases (Major Intrinsic Protein Family)
VTLTFWRLGKVKNWDAFFYVIAQFIGGIAGMFVVALVARMTLSHPAVNYVATLPGPHGMTIAFIAELIIAFILMTVVLNVSNTPHLARFTGIFAGCLVATYITFEGPFSGMSMNPARTSVRLLSVISGPDSGFISLRRCCHAACRNALSPQQTPSLLREISPLQSAPLHFQLPLP